MSLVEGQALMSKCNSEAAKTSNEAGREQSREIRPALHAEGKKAREEKEAAT